MRRQFSILKEAPEELLLEQQCVCPGFSVRHQPFLAGEALEPALWNAGDATCELSRARHQGSLPAPGSPWHEDQHAVGADGVDDPVGHAALVALGAPVSEVHALEELCGLLLGTLGCLRAPHTHTQTKTYVNIPTSISAFDFHSCFSPLFNLLPVPPKNYI